MLVDCRMFFSPVSIDKFRTSEANMALSSASNYSMTRKPVQYCVVDAFTDEVFKGNPAAVCLLEEEKDEEWLQALASEFNLSETCYLTQLTDPTESANESATSSPIPRFRLRWFTPVAEVKLCGHATLAASHFLFTYGLVNAETIEFSTLSGILTAKRVPETKISYSSHFQNGDASGTWFIELNFPVDPIREFDGVADVTAVSKSLNGASVMEIKQTTTGNDVLDPVCGSAHCALASYWSKRLGKSDFVAYQASPRSGVLNLHLDEQNQRVLLMGKATVVMEGSVLV